ncbi:uncharacterized protein B0H18DRAFT_884210 [Fomitopsis serialis]|uniref:uncharacterized protein n=1 Tax=Fomitopsis serialis TaxID=139415 RepID=UPI002007841A|nr:uncharacterized protein B0H18DRAFT_884210 [Neoantrodia serialis]KAH9917019.1 hypothetical protein B0H18DRAFT_884210 [Neoantrodia serialis]
MSSLFTSSRSSSKTRWVPGHAPSDSEADLLPKVNGVPARSGLWFTRRYTKLAVAFLIGLALFWAVISLGTNYWRWRDAPVVSAVLPDPIVRMPPDYARFHEYELQTSEQNGDFADTKYMFFANHARNSGWGNVMQELLLQALLAHRMGRTFVYYNYTWRDDGSQISYFDDKPIPSTIPLSALLQGPMLGAPSVTDPSAARPFAVTEDYYRRVCPEGERKYIRTEEVSSRLGGKVPTAANMIEKWVEVFGDLPDKCVEIPHDAPSNFDIFIFGDASRLLDVWPVLSTSPILQEFAWSPLVELAFDQNREAFAPTHVYVPPLGTQPLVAPARGSGAPSPSAARYAAIPGLLAFHIRRGDFAEHCANLARWGSAYVGHNAFPALPDRFGYPPDTTDDERVALQRPHCFPNMARSCGGGGGARGGTGGGPAGAGGHVFMTNAPGEWVDELREAVRATGGWRTVASSRELEVNWEQRFVKQAVDMLIGQRAEVFVGNGYSSLSGLVTMFRMANGIPPAQNRLL